MSHWIGRDGMARVSDERGYRFPTRPLTVDEMYRRRVRELRDQRVAERLKKREALQKAYEARESEHFLRWLRIRCFEDDMVETPRAHLLASYRHWCQRTGEKERGVGAWGAWMRDHYPVADRRWDGKKGVGVYIGIGLKEPPKPMAPPPAVGRREGWSTNF